jgi:ABC-type multidrug transport system fused ATPase/permease subunit
MSETEKEPPMKILIVDKMSALITAAFGLVAALAWNEAIKAIFKEIFGTADAVAPMLIYAIVVTIAAVIMTIIVARSLSKMKAKL